MLTLEEMILRLIIASVLGALIGLEREFFKKDAGIRTNMLVSAGAAIFSMVGIMIHYVIGLPADGENYLPQVMQSARGIAIIAGIVTGVGFLGAGVIIQDGLRTRGLTTAAAVWFVASVGTLVGIGLIGLAAAATFIALLFLIGLRPLDPYKMVHRGSSQEEKEEDEYEE